MEHDKLGRRLLLYVESCCVDGRGFIDGRRINAEERDLLKEWNSTGYIEYGRVPMDVIESRPGNAGSETEWCRLSEEAWSDASDLRRGKAGRTEDLRAEKYGEFPRWQGKA